MLDHQNIVRFKEVYRTAKMKLNIVMEYASGGDVAQKIK
jgi:NIMA (never in mitosis gene a)-related kinase